MFTLVGVTVVQVIQQYQSSKYLSGPEFLWKSWCVSSLNFAKFYRKLSSLQTNGSRKEIYLSMLPGVYIIFKQFM